MKAIKQILMHLFCDSVHKCVKQYFSYIVAVSFIGGGNVSKSLTNFII